MCFFAFAALKKNCIAKKYALFGVNFVCLKFGWCKENDILLQHLPGCLFLKSYIKSPAPDVGQHFMKSGLKGQTMTGLPGIQVDRSLVKIWDFGMGGARLYVKIVGMIKQFICLCCHSHLVTTCGLTPNSQNCVIQIVCRYLQRWKNIQACEQCLCNFCRTQEGPAYTWPFNFHTFGLRE